MGFWNYLGLACLLDQLFGKKKYIDTPDTTRIYNPRREAELDERYITLSDRIDALDINSITLTHLLNCTMTCTMILNCFEMNLTI